jgi:hypothetical protein
MPIIGTGIEQAGQLSCIRIDSSHVGALVPVAVYTCNGEIIEAVAAAMLLRNDVVDPERRRVQRGW